MYDLISIFRKKTNYV